MELGIPIVNKRISVTPVRIFLLLSCISDNEKKQIPHKVQAHLPNSLSHGCAVPAPSKRELLWQVILCLSDIGICAKFWIYSFPEKKKANRSRFAFLMGLFN